MAPGEVVAEYGSDNPDAVWMVHTGRIELSNPDDTVDSFESVGPGDIFGYLPLIIGPVASFVARATEPSELIALPTDEMRHIFTQRSGLTFVAESAWHTITTRPDSSARWSPTRRVAELLRRPPVFVTADTPVADAVRTMGAAGESCVLIEMADGTLGIVTESDVTHRLVGAGLSPTVPVHRIMSYPARVVDADRYAATTWLEMLDAGVRHMPVCSTRGRAIGVIEETDLLVAASRGASVQREIAQAVDAADLTRVTRAVPKLADELFTNGFDAETTCGVLSLVVDTTAHRAVELALAADPGLGGFAWISLGSVARREAMPSSDVDAALSWADDRDDDAPRYRQMAQRTHEILDACGLPADSNGAVAFRSRFSRSASGWRQAAQDWLDTPLADHGLIMSSLLIDGRVILGRNALHTVPAVFASMPDEHPEALRLQRLDALSTKPRFRSLRDVLSRRGNTVDLKTHLISPIVNLARWAGLTAGITSAPTPSRLHGAVDAGTLAAEDATVLHDVFAMTQRLRLRHQVQQIRAGHMPGDVITMSDLSPLERSMLGEGVHEVVAIQRRVRSGAATG
ncbi:MAG: putative nucleotidyltransferase substrate binding domain-containing protein [Gordonia sp. (in: high G+C Gram-positive bacteria)]